MKFKKRLILFCTLILVFIMTSGVVVADSSAANWARVYCVYNAGAGSTACDSGQTAGDGPANCNVIEGTHCAEEGNIYCYSQFYCEGDPQGTTPLTSSSGNSPVTAFNINWDTDSTDCICYAGSNTWSIGGETAATSCCGDDANEYRRTRVAGTDSTYSSSSTDDGCCTASTDCISSSTCYDSGNTLGTIPSKNYCNAGTWQGGDAGSTQCTAVAGASLWSIGGEVAATSCCGDDSSEYKITRVAAGDSTYTSSSSDDACCTASTDCAYSSTCYDSGNTLGTIPSKNYCNAGTWQGGDDGSTQCAAIVASGRWNIGGETASTTCCGDDSLEYRRTRIAGTDSSYTSSTSDDACCTSSDNCVYSSTCYNPGDTLGTIPDKNYCSSAGEWQGGDTGSTQCAAVVASGRWNIGGEVAATSCCGDDTGENYITAGVGSQSCCDASTDCVDSGNVCRDNVEENSGILCTDGIDNDCDGLTDGAEATCGGSISGYVRDENTNPMDAAKIEVYEDGVLVGETYSIADGSYTVGSAPGTFEVVATYPDYVSGTITGVTVAALETVTGVNFQLTYGLTCEADCTYLLDDKVHSECNGQNGCSFYDTTAVQVCDSAKHGWDVDYNESHTIECPSGEPVEKENIPAVPTCSEQSLVKFYRIIKYQGKSVKMVTVVCGE